MYFIAVYNLQSVGVSKSLQKPVTLVQLQVSVNIAGSVGALIAVWYSLLLKNMLEARTFWCINKPRVCLYCLGAPKSPQKVSGATQNLAKMDGGQVSSVGELTVTFFSFEQVL